MNAAVCCFAYNRPDKLKFTLEALTRCTGIEQTPICFIQDNVKPYHTDEGVNAVRRCIEKFIKENPKLNIEYIQWRQNAGPYISLTKGLAYALNKYGCAVRLEDDIEVRADYLTYMNEALEYYKDNPEIFAVCSYNPEFICESSEVFLSKRLSIWGFGTWKERFVKVMNRMEYMSQIFENYDCEDAYMIQPHYGGETNNQFMGLYRNEPEDVRMRLCLPAENMLCVYANTSYCRNIGFDGSGTTQVILKPIENKNFNREASALNFSEAYRLSEEEEWKHVISWMKMLNPVTLSQIPKRYKYLI